MSNLVGIDRAGLFEVMDEVGAEIARLERELRAARKEAEEWKARCAILIDRLGES